MIAALAWLSVPQPHFVVVTPISGASQTVNSLAVHTNQDFDSTNFKTSREESRRVALAIGQTNS